MVIEGEITALMESWPLQLTVHTNSGPYHVQLDTETEVTRRGQRVDPGVLSPGIRVAVEGQSSSKAGPAMMARAIRILE